ncbi:MAG: potassium channel family protein [Chloroflexota bacterium]
MAALELAIGVAIVLAVLFDVFQTVVLPRPTPAVFRPSAAIIGSLWALTYHVAIGMRNAGRRELVLGTFAPFIVALLLVTWVVLLVAGYGLMLFALRHQVQPSPTGLGTALYFSGVALFTLGYGDFVAVGAAARVIVLVEAGTGIGIVALVITFLFTLFGAYQRRETLVISLSARAGAPPSGLVLLETYAKLAMVPELALVFAAWETWSAEVLDSHLSYPLLAFFRSTHDNQSWISGLGAVLDAAALVLTTVEDVPRGPAYLLQSVGTHLVGDLGQHFHLNGSHDPYVEEAEFTTARDRLLAAGYHLKEAPSSWLAFSHLRSEYAGILNDMAKRWATPPALWIGDRSRLRPHGRGHR